MAHDIKTLIAEYCEALGEQLTGDAFVVELLEGPTSGKRLAGRVGWTGVGWRVLMNRSTSDWQLWRRLLHEVGHVYLGDVSKTVSEADALDRALIAGQAGSRGEARLQDYRDEDDPRELRATAWGDAMAKGLLDALNRYLADIDAGASVPAALSKQGLGRSLAALAKAIASKHGVDLAPQARRRKVVAFKAAELDEAAKAADDKAAFVRAVLARRRQYLAWLQELFEKGLIAPAGAV